MKCRFCENKLNYTFMDFTKNPIEIEYFNSSGYDIKNDYYGNKFKTFFITII